MHVHHIATGILKGYDQLLNLVIDGCIEHVQGNVFVYATGGTECCA